MKTAIETRRASGAIDNPAARWFAVFDVEADDDVEPEMGRCQACALASGTRL